MSTNPIEIRENLDNFVKLMKSLTCSRELQQHLECLVDEFLQRWDPKTMELTLSFVRAKVFHDPSLQRLQNNFQMMGKAQNISPELQSLLENLVKGLEDIRDRGKFNEYIDAIRSRTSSDDLRSSLKNIDLTAKLKNLGLVPKMPSFSGPDNYSIALGITVLRDSFTELMKTQDISAELRSLLKEVDKEFEDMRNTAMIFLFFDFIEDHFSEDLKLLLQDNLIRELVGDKGLVEGITNLLDVVEDLKSAGKRLGETFTQSINDERTSCESRSLLEVFNRELDNGDVVAMRGYFTISNILSLFHENENLTAEPNNSRLREQMSDFFEAEDRVACVAASLHNNFTQFVKGQPNHTLCPLLKGFNKELLSKRKC